MRIWVSLFHKYKFPKEIYTYIHARNFETALELLEVSASQHGQGYDYYKCLAKIATLREDYREAIDLYGRAINDTRAGNARFLVYGDLMRVLLLAGEGHEAATLLRRAVDDLEHVLKKTVLSAQSIIHLSKFVMRLGLAGAYMDLIVRQSCWNPWDKKLRAARGDLMRRQERCCALQVLQGNVGYSLGTFKLGSDPAHENAEVVVYWPTGYLSLVLRDFEGIFEYYRAILAFLQNEGIHFRVEAQFLHNHCPEVTGMKVLSWHTYGVVSGGRHLKEAPLPGFFYFDQAGYSGWSEIAGYSRQEMELKINAIEVAEAEDYFQGLIGRFITTGKSKYLQSSESLPQLPDRYIFIPLQLLDDHVTRLTDWDMMRFVRHVMGLLRQTDIAIVLKRHPKCRNYRVDAFLEALKEEPAVYILDASIHGLIEHSLAVCTINSGVGVEALLFGKRVFTASPSDYSFLARDIRGIEEGADFIAQIEETTDRIQYAQFMTFYCRDYLVDAFDQKSIELHMREWLD
jgi:tetratricopeptide (TPR) repeat protein